VAEAPPGVEILWRGFLIFWEPARSAVFFVQSLSEIALWKVTSGSRPWLAFRNER
jgi:hypothetical protein